MEAPFKLLSLLQNDKSKNVDVKDRIRTVEHL